MRTSVANSNDISQLQGETLALILCDRSRLDLSNEAIEALEGYVERAGCLARHGGYGCGGV